LDDAEPLHLSEQEGVDCVEECYGCNGGWMDYYWDFSEENGSQTARDYPYTASDDDCVR